MYATAMSVTYWTVLQSADSLPFMTCYWRQRWLSNCRAWRFELAFVWHEYSILHVCLFSDFLSRISMCKHAERDILYSISLLPSNAGTAPNCQNDYTYCPIVSPSTKDHYSSFSRCSELWNSNGKGAIMQVDFKIFGLKTLNNGSKPLIVIVTRQKLYNK